MLGLVVGIIGIFLVVFLIVFLFAIDAKIEFSRGSILMGVVRSIISSFSIFGVCLVFFDVTNLIGIVVCGSAIVLFVFFMLGIHPGTWVELYFGKGSMKPKNKG